MPQSNRPAEVALLATLIADVFSDFDFVLSKISAADFEHADTRTIFCGIESVYKKTGSLPCFADLGAELTSMGVADKMDSTLLDTLLEPGPPGSLQLFAETIHEASTWRRFFKLLQKHGRVARSDDAQGVYRSVNDCIRDLGEIASREGTSGFRGMHQIVHEIVADTQRVIETGSITGIPLPLPLMTEKMGQVEFGQFVVVVADTSHGKTAFSLQWTHYLAKVCKIPVAVISLEMKDKALIKRRMGVDTGIGSRNIGMGNVTPTDMAKMQEYEAQSRQWPIFVASRSNRSLHSIMALMREAVREQGSRVIVVDYIQLLNIENYKGSRTNELTDIANAFQSFAIENDVIVVAPSQVKRFEFSAKDHTPGCGDIKDSGGIANAADVVIGLNRLSAHIKSGEAPDPSSVHDVNVNIDKNRNDLTPKFNIGWIPNKQLFVDVDPDGF